MQPDTELDIWRNEWQAQNTELPDLKPRVEREIRLARLGRAAASAVTVAFGAGMPLWALSSRRIDVVVLAVGTWVLLVVAWIVSLRLGGGWDPRPSGTTTSAYLQFSILSCQRRRKAIGAGAVLYGAVLAFVLAWKYHETSQGTGIGLGAFLASPPILNVWAITLALALLGWWRQRQIAVTLRNLVDLQERLQRT